MIIDNAYHSGVLVTLLLAGLGYAAWQVFSFIIARSRNGIIFENGSLTRYVVQYALLVIGLLALGAALLQPRTQEKNAGQKAIEYRDIIFALDISRSMCAVDAFGISRLDHAKKKIKDIVRRLGADRVALILFSGEAWVQCPLTRDIRVFGLYLDDVRPELVSAATTNITAALEVVATLYPATASSNNEHVCVLFSDGEDFSKAEQQMRSALQKRSIKLFACGVGSPEGSPMPEYNHKGELVGYITDTLGHVAISTPNFQLLKDMAHAAGGKFIASTPDNADVYAIKQWLEYFHGQSQVVDQQQAYTHWYWIPATVAFVSLGIASCI